MRGQSLPSSATIPEASDPELSKAASIGSKRAHHLACLVHRQRRRLLLTRELRTQHLHTDPNQIAAIVPSERIFRQKYVAHRLVSQGLSLSLRLEGVALFVHQKLADVEVSIKEVLRQLASLDIFSPVNRVKSEAHVSDALYVIWIGFAGFTMSSEMHRLSANERLSTHKSSNRST